ncbi:MAG: hypothetical protein ACE37I_08575 [Rubinisphaera brasiliensis]|uniref:Uncharacterized protein n=1 Tax=Rubinisphaera brasiliensis (strain ATCC 49424 / DSM 5305 / JCM 21570 / IAM 15109 / NBRC 103401 / IFAM 1448) TaxID=756272 RepID=F0SJS4_RUBBR|nr:hypothetical protein [Rubinisphaera brasiliensis]ADY61912.1 hypothetical protein Plabr_4339 [Rubinisphaera brasiliensis DSM 5305]MBR9801724.1 hypothetical protein [bacterium]
MRLLTGILLAVLVYGLWFPVAANAKIEAVKGKQYSLTDKHGPWMVMVAVFSEPPEEMKSEGMTPEQAAESLVMELREQGIPAYSYRREKSFGSVQTVSRMQEKTERHYKLDTEICVLAGNYKSPDADRELAKRTLEWLKEYQPKSLEKGGIYKPTPGQPSLLSGAFLTINPMLDPAAVKKQQQAPELIRYNSHCDYSLLENDGKYTVVVASFYPNSVTQVGASGDVSGKLRDSAFGKETDMQAWQVMQALRNHEKKFDAYVWHTHKKSIVTVGAFDSPTDPRIAEIQRTFGAQVKVDPNTGQQQVLGEVIVLPEENGQWMCTFDPRPEVIEVPFRDRRK